MAELPASGPRFEARYYEQEYPEVEDCVVVLVKSIEDMGAYVSLLEYNGIEGMILLSELSRRRIRSINRLIRVGKTEIVTVLRVDREKGYIDLSKRRVNDDDIKAVEAKFNKSKTVQSIMRHVTSKIEGATLEDMHRKITWPLYKKYGHAFDAFKAAVNGHEAEVFEGLEIDDYVRILILDNVRRRLTPQPVKVRSDIELTCFTYEGIEAIRAALLAGQEVTTDDVPLKIMLIAPPLYVLLSNTLDGDLGVATLNRAIERISEVISGHGGKCAVKMAPKVTSEREESELKSKMEELARKNAEVDGDEEEDE